MPRPVAWTQPMSREAQNGHATRGYMKGFPQARHLGIISLPLAGAFPVGFRFGRDRSGQRAFEVHGRGF